MMSWIKQHPLVHDPHILDAITVYLDGKRLDHKLRPIYRVVEERPGHYQEAICHLGYAGLEIHCHQGAVEIYTFPYGLAKRDSFFDVDVYHCSVNDFDLFPKILDLLQRYDRIDWVLE